MNPYQYCDPPIGTVLLEESTTNIKTTVWAGKSSKMNRKSNTYCILQFCIGVFLGYLVIHLVKNIIFTSNLCSGRVETQNKEKFSNSKKNLIYVGVMTANKYISTRAKAVYETWGNDVPGNINFFCSEMSETNENLPVVKLKGVDDAYPPQKKSFLMLKYMYDHHLNDYEYFMRVDDDLYIKMDRLEKFLKTINSSKLYFIGQPGMGNSEEIGRLSLTEKQNFCMGGTGMIFTRATLEKLAPHIKKCLKNLKTTHEDVEIGRCVQKYVGIPCTWSYEMQNIFYHNESHSDAFTGPLKQRDVHRAITLHPIKKHLYLYRLHAYLLSLRIKEQEYEIIEAVREAARLARDLDLPLPSLDDPEQGVFVDQLGMEASLQKWRASSVSSALEWSFYRGGNAYQAPDANPQHRMTADVKEAHEDVIRDVMETLNRVSKERGRIIVFKDILYGYARRHPSYGPELILDMLLLYRRHAGRRVTMPVRRHAYVQVPFGPLNVRVVAGAEMASQRGGASKVADSLLETGLSRLRYWKTKMSSAERSVPPLRVPKEVTFILPLAGKWGAFQRFMANYRRVCLDRGERVRLVVVSFRASLGQEDSRRRVADLLADTRRLYPEAKVTLVKSESSFARALAMDLGAAQCGARELLFFVDVDMSFSAETLDRIRVNTVRGRQVYFPVVFSEFESKSAGGGGPGQEGSVPLSEVSGYWRRHGYGIAALHKSDLVRVGGYDTGIVGWGKEDVDLFDKVIKAQYLSVVRSPDPDLVHNFHRVSCDSQLEPKQLAMCEGSRLTNYEAGSSLARTLVQKPEILMFKRTQDS